MTSNRFVTNALMAALLPAALSACTFSAGGDAAADRQAASDEADPAPTTMAMAPGGAAASASMPGVPDGSTEPPQEGAPATDPGKDTAAGKVPPVALPVKAAPADAELAQDSPLRAQVLLERSFFSPGEIDGAAGSNMAKAISGYQRANDLEVTGTMNEATWTALNGDSAPILVEHTLTETDVAGPFGEIPADTMAKAELDALPYSSVEEKLGEQFHSSPALLKRLNPEADLSVVGTVITVPNIASAKQMPTPARVIVDKSDAALLLEDASGKIVGQFTVTTGSAQFPLPIGEWKIEGVARNPVWYFDPKLIAGTKKTDTKAEIPPGPNNPVGTVWIDLSKEHYGIHGTPNPSKVGKTESNGCIRMTNWSAEALSKVVKPGMQVTMRE